MSRQETGEIRHVIGLMSGTSVDGIDAALVKITGSGFDTKVDLQAFTNYPFPEEVRREVFSLFSPTTGTVDRICQMNFLLGELFAEAAFAVVDQTELSMADIDLIGSHGQTVYHIPAPSLIAGRMVKSTLQIGEPSVIAERTGVTTIADFRTRDMAAGGEGAPLVPLADYVLFRSKEKTRVLQNIGGIGNLTVLPAGAEINSVIAFDTGPGNMIIDGVVSLITEGAQAYDKDGKLGAAGQVQEELLAELMSHPFFGKEPPKSTGREEFGVQFARPLVERARSQGVADNNLIATITAFTAESIAYHYRRHVIPKWGLDEVIVSGGGSYNPTLVGMIAARLPGANVLTVDELGMSSDAKEAIAFALLANETYNMRPGNVPSATGASGPVILGKIIPGSKASF